MTDEYGWTLHFAPAHDSALADLARLVPVVRGAALSLAADVDVVIEEIDVPLTGGESVVYYAENGIVAVGTTTGGLAAVAEVAAAIVTATSGGVRVIASGASCVVHEDDAGEIVLPFGATPLDELNAWKEAAAAAGR